MQYNVNGELVDAEAATLSVRDRGFRYGDAAFETLRAYGGELFRWDAHHDRLRETCEVLGFEGALDDHGLDGGALRERVLETLRANDLRDARARLSITRGVQPGALAPREDVDPTVVVTVAPLPRGGSRGEPVWDGPATVAVTDRHRVPDAAVPARAKTHNYLGGVLARLDDRGEPVADEVLLLDGDADGRVLAEGTVSNAFVVEDRTLRTPALSGPVLPGVTRAAVLELAAERDLTVETGQVTVEALRRADEAFLTNTTWAVRPVGRVRAADGDWGPVEVPEARPVTRALADAFDAHVESEHY